MTTKRPRTLADRLLRAAPVVGAIALIISSVWGGYAFLEARFATAGDLSGVREEIRELKRFTTRSERNALQRERFQITSVAAKERRPLTQAEAERLQQLDLELVDIAARLRTLDAKPP